MTDPSLSPEAEAALAQVDALTAHAVGWVAPIQFRVAQTESDKLAAYRLRYQAVVEHGWLRPEDLPDGLERDAYDEQAIHILAWDGVKPAATCRLVLPGHYPRLPTEEAFDLQLEPMGQVVDGGRFVVARAYTSLEHRLLAALVARGWLEVRAHGYRHVCAAFASLSMIRVYARLGVRTQVLGPARYYWGTDRYPILLDAVASAPGLMERWGSPPAAGP